MRCNISLLHVCRSFVSQKKSVASSSAVSQMAKDPLWLTTDASELGSDWKEWPAEELSDVENLANVREAEDAKMSPGEMEEYVKSVSQPKEGGRASAAAKAIANAGFESSTAGESSGSEFELASIDSEGKKSRKQKKSNKKQKNP
jgi:hypothetical protein